MFQMRGLHALRRLGGQAMVGLMNELFSAIGQHAESRGGEPKFIGDAMLVIFPVEDGHQPQVARQMMSCVNESVAQIEALAASKQLDWALGLDATLAVSSRERGHAHTTRFHGDGAGR